MGTLRFDLSEARRQNTIPAVFVSLAEYQSSSTSVFRSVSLISSFLLESFMFSLKRNRFFITLTLASSWISSSFPVALLIASRRASSLISPTSQALEADEASTGYT